MHVAAVVRFQTGVATGQLRQFVAVVTQVAQLALQATQAVVPLKYWPAVH